MTLSSPGALSLFSLLMAILTMRECEMVVRLCRRTVDRETPGAVEIRAELVASLYQPVEIIAQHAVLFFDNDDVLLFEALLFFLTNFRYQFFFRALTCCSSW